MTRFAMTLLLLGIGGAHLQAFERPADAVQPENPVGKHDWLVKNETIQALLAKTNAHRASMGIGPVRLDAEMSLAAQRHANWMAETGFYQHSGLPYMEIIFSGPTTVDAAIQGWIASPAHHSIMLSGTQVGFGYMIRNGRPYWVGVFR
jgi:uncharacterized protein YkwD